MRVLDLFCGCGGASEGYRQAGLEVAAVADNDEVAMASHLENHPDAEHYEMDLADPTDLISIFTRGEFDVIHGSPPCPDFSQANNNPDPKRGMVLINAYERVVDELHPRWFVMENVRPVLKFLDGFYPRKRVLNAADFGVPQTRIRAFCGNFPDPQPTHSKRSRMTLDRGRLKQWVSVREALGLECVIDTGRDWRPDGSHKVRDGEEPVPAMTAKAGGQFQMVSKHCVSGEKGTRAVRDVDDPAFTVNTNMSGVYLNHKRYAPSGKERLRTLDNPAFCVSTYPDLSLWTGGESIHGNTRAKMRSLDDPSFTVLSIPGRLMEPSPCITATEYRFSPGAAEKNNRRRASHAFRRQLTPEECMLLQGFPPDYVVLGNKTQRYRQIGNAVPPPMTRAIGEAILHHSRL